MIFNKLTIPFLLLANIFQIPVYTFNTIHTIEQQHSNDQTMWDLKKPKHTL